MEALSNSKDHRTSSTAKGSVTFLLARLTKLLNNHTPDRLEALAHHMPADIETALRNALSKDGRTHYAIGKAADIAPAILDRFATGERSLTLPVASRLAQELGLQLIATGKLDQLKERIEAALKGPFNHSKGNRTRASRRTR